MAKVYPKRLDGVPCRLCGAAHARPSSNRFGVCDSCLRSYEYRNGHSKLSDEDFVILLARNLKNSIKRLSDGQMLGRCEALSSAPHVREEQRGYQCASLARYVRDGHNVCHSHARSTINTYIDHPENQRNGYDIIREMVGELCRSDREFLSAIEGALADARKRAA